MIVWDPCHVIKTFMQLYALLSEPWSAFRADTASPHSYGRLMVINETHLLFEQVSVDFNTTIDKFWLIQHNHGARIENWECDEGFSNHLSCRCPLPFHYVTVAIFAGIFFFIITAMSVYFCTKCCCCCQTNNRFACRKCCYTSSGLRLCRYGRSRLKERSGRLRLLAEDDDEDVILWYFVHSW